MATLPLPVSVRREKQRTGRGRHAFNQAYTTETASKVPRSPRRRYLRPFKKINVKRGRAIANQLSNFTAKIGFV